MGKMRHLTVKNDYHERGAGSGSGSGSGVTTMKSAESSRMAGKIPDSCGGLSGPFFSLDGMEANYWGSYWLLEWGMTCFAETSINWRFPDQTFH